MGVLNNNNCHQAVNEKFRKANWCSLSRPVYEVETICGLLKIFFPNSSPKNRTHEKTANSN